MVQLAFRYKIIQPISYIENVFNVNCEVVILTILRSLANRWNMCYCSMNGSNILLVVRTSLRAQISSSLFSGY